MSRPYLLALLLALFATGTLAGMGGTMLARDDDHQEVAWYAFGGGILAGLIALVLILHGMGWE